MAADENRGKADDGIALAREDGVAIVTLDRPARRNAVTLAMWRKLGALFHGFAKERSVRAVILTGAGGHFSAGADIGEFATLRHTVALGIAYEDAVEACETAIAELAKPTIAAVAGYCVGGGCGLALACDFRIAARDARFAITPAKLGIVYGLRETRYLYRAVGLAHAKRILFTAEQLDAGEALRIGLVERVVEGAPLEAARALAAQLAALAPRSIAGAKHILNALAEGRAEPAEAARLTAEALASADYREGVAAFGAKRRPRFTGA